MAAGQLFCLPEPGAAGDGGLSGQDAAACLLQPGRPGTGRPVGPAGGGGSLRRRGLPRFFGRGAGHCPPVRDGVWSAGQRPATGAAAGAAAAVQSGTRGGLAAGGCPCGLGGGAASGLCPVPPGGRAGVCPQAGEAERRGADAPAGPGGAVPDPGGGEPQRLPHRPGPHGEAEAGAGDRLRGGTAGPGQAGGLLCGGAAVSCP